MGKGSTGVKAVAWLRHVAGNTLKFLAFIACFCAVEPALADSVNGA